MGYGIGSPPSREPCLKIRLPLLFIAPWLLAVATPGSHAQCSRIERVTVYPGLAAVERNARVAAGAREQVPNCLSPNFDTASLWFDAEAGIRLGPVSAISRPRLQHPRQRWRVLSPPRWPMLPSSARPAKGRSSSP